MFNPGGPEDKFDEEAVMKDEGPDFLEDEIDDQTIITVIEIFAEERDGAYYGKNEKIGTKEDCIKWVKGILKRELDV